MIRYEELPHNKRYLQLWGETNVGEQWHKRKGRVTEKASGGIIKNIEKNGVSGRSFQKEAGQRYGERTLGPQCTAANKKKMVSDSQ